MERMTAETGAMRVVPIVPALPTSTVVGMVSAFQLRTDAMDTINVMTAQTRSTVHVRRRRVSSVSMVTALFGRSCVIERTIVRTDRTSSIARPNVQPMNSPVSRTDRVC
jgi:hypothetical protein